MNLWREVLAAVAVLFLGFLVVKLRPGGPRRGALASEVRAARERAHTAATPRARAEALCEAGTLSIQQGARWTAAAGFFVRAMNADAAWPGAVERTIAAFHKKRPELLEKMLWRRLAHVPWDAEHRAALRAAAHGLEHLYAHELRDAAKADVFRRLARQFEA